jgi:hypothetical protein
LVRPTLDNLCSPSAHSAHDGGWVEDGRDNTSLTLCVDKSHHCESRGSTFRSFLFPSSAFESTKWEGGRVRGGERMDESGRGRRRHSRTTPGSTRLRSHWTATRRRPGSIQHRPNREEAGIGTGPIVRAHQTRLHRSSSLSRIRTNERRTYTERWRKTKMAS